MLAATLENLIYIVFLLKEFIENKKKLLLTIYKHSDSSQITNNQNE